MVLRFVEMFVRKSLQSNIILSLMSLAIEGRYLLVNLDDVHQVVKQHTGKLLRIYYNIEINLN